MLHIIDKYYDVTTMVHMMYEGVTYIICGGQWIVPRAHCALGEHTSDVL